MKERRDLTLKIRDDIYTIGPGWMRLLIILLVAFFAFVLKFFGIMLEPP